ncbi:MAG TPA: class I SAM-dependent methyltransferase [Chloroflexota bacterium]
MTGSARGWGAVDWVANWQQIVEGRRQRVEALGEGNRAGGDFWDRRADQFRRMSEQHDPRHDLLVGMLTEALGSDGTLLDVGAGAGRYALPIAQRGLAVTAVEPSAGMRRNLEERVQQAGVAANLHVVASTWEDAAVAPHDVVLASHILYPIADVVPFIQKLVAHARRAWFLTIRVEPMGGELVPLWQEVRGTSYPMEPTFLDLYNLLFAIGLRPSVRLRPFAGGGQAAGNLDDVIQQVRGRLFLAEDDHQYDDAIRRYVHSNMQERDGQWQWPQQRQEAIISAPV